MSVPVRLWRLLAGKPRDLKDSGLFHRLSLIPFLAWVGLGADGLSSSSYGPEEAFRSLGEHRFLAVGLAAATAFTVLLISAAYRRIIEVFPTGGGGYVVASRLLGERAGLVSGSALLVDYVLTITISLAAAGDALFSFLPIAWQGIKLPVEIGLLAGLTALNLRGVRESVLTLLPVFLLFLVTHAILIGAGVLLHAGQMPATATAVAGDLREGVASVGVVGLLLVFLRAYAMGGGTYTGIEAVSNGLPIMREPRQETGKRTMIYMGISLAVTAAGLLLCYLLWDLRPVAGKTLNAVLVERIAGGVLGGGVFVVLTLFAEAALLVVAAQAGFLDGPRVLANMAVDSWVPHRFAALSDRLTAHNGILLMGAAALAALWYTGGNVGHLVVMYSINVFLTFTLSMLSMLRYWRAERNRPEARRRLALFGAGFALCVTILGVTVVEKFAEGGWVTVMITLALVGFCLLIRRHYRGAAATVDRLYRELGDLPAQEGATPQAPRSEAARRARARGELRWRRHPHDAECVPGVPRSLQGHRVPLGRRGRFRGVQGRRRGPPARERTEEMLRRYAGLAASQGVPAAYRFSIGTEVVAEAERLCLEVSREFPRSTVFTGRMMFQRERWWHPFLHNRTALAIQKRLQWAGRTMVTLPIRVRE
jgi:amino acid transporter